MTIQRFTLSHLRAWSVDRSGMPRETSSEMHGGDPLLNAHENRSRQQVNYSRIGARVDSQIAATIQTSLIEIANHYVIRRDRLHFPCWLRAVLFKEIHDLRHSFTPVTLRVVCWLEKLIELSPIQQRFAVLFRNAVWVGLGFQQKVRRSWA